MHRWVLTAGALLVTVALAGTVIVDNPKTDAAHFFAGMLWIGGVVLAVALVWQFLAWARGRTAAK